MRTLHADLTTAQQSASSTPYLRINLESRDRATTYAYDLTDNRIINIQQAMGEFGGALENTGKPFTVSCRVVLNNSDQTLSSIDFRGYRMTIDWGFNTASGNRYATFGPEFVLAQDLISFQGASYVELHCASLWEMGNNYFLNINNERPRRWIRGITVDTENDREAPIKFILQEVLGGELIGTQLASVYQSLAFRADAGTIFTNYTDEAHSPAEGDVRFTGTIPAVNDAVYFGAVDVFDRISFDITAVLTSGSLTSTWEYWNGSTWSALTAYEGASHFNPDTNTGLYIEAFDKPTDWATTTADTITSGSISNTTAMYFVRWRVTGVTSPVTLDGLKSSSISTGHDFAYGQLTADSSQGDDYKPSYGTTISHTLALTAAEILSFTLMGVIIRPEGFYGLFIDNAQASADYSYEVGGSHAFYIHNEGRQSIIPNFIRVLNDDPRLVDTADYEGTDSDSDSIDDLGTISSIVVDLGVESNAEATTQAQRRIKQLQRNKAQGQAEVPMNVGQEIYDLVEFVDTRTGRTTTGRVTQLIRLFQSGQYRMHIILGGLTRGVGYAQLPLLQEALFQAGDTVTVSQLLSELDRLNRPVAVRPGEPGFTGPLTAVESTRRDQPIAQPRFTPELAPTNLEIITPEIPSNIPGVQPSPPLSVQRQSFFERHPLIRRILGTLTSGVSLPGRRPRE